MTDPFKIDGPTCISFSGGRTSAYMLWRVLQANGGLPPEASVCFANTGLEAEETLEFVRNCEDRWAVPITWLEYRTPIGADLLRGRLEVAIGNALLPAGYEAVNFDTASRNGEPFEALIRRRQFLPNPVSRFCTSELKIRTMHRFIRAELDWEEWDQMIGIRADEQRRVSKIRARGTSIQTKDETMLMPLADAGISVQDVGAFWDAQPFNLELPTVNGRTLEGNCVYCFLKPPAQRLSIARAGKYPIGWYVRAEDGSMVPGATGRGARFTKDGPSYAEIEAYARDQREMFDPNEEAIACFCGD